MAAKKSGAKKSKKDPKLKAAGVSGYNKPKATPGHKTVHVAAAKVGNKTKTIRFGQKGVGLEARHGTQQGIQGQARQEHQEGQDVGGVLGKQEEVVVMAKGLYANIHAKRRRIKGGSGEKMRKPGSKGAYKQGVQGFGQDGKEAEEDQQEPVMDWGPIKKSPFATCRAR